MSKLTAITQKNQVHIPKHIRDKIGLKTPTKAKITTQSGKIIIEPVAHNPIKQLAGKYSSKNSQLNVDNIRDLVDYTDL